MARRGEINARVRVQDRTKPGLNQAKRSVSTFATQVKGITAGVVGGDIISGAGRAAMMRVEQFFRAGVDFTKAMETANAQFKVLLGSGGLAQGQVNFIRQFAADTPFFIQSVTNASRLLVQFIGNTTEANKALTLVGDAAAGAGVDIENVALWWGRFIDAARAGRPVGEATARLQELGLIGGQARSEIEELIKAGKGMEAIDVGTQALQRTSGAMEELRGTLAGAIDTAQNATQEFSAMTLKITGVTDALVTGADAWTTWANQAVRGMEVLDQQPGFWRKIQLMIAALSITGPSTGFAGIGTILEGLATVGETPAETALRRNRDIEGWLYGALPTPPGGTGAGGGGGEAPFAAPGGPIVSGTRPDGRRYVDTRPSGRGGFALPGGPLQRGVDELRFIDHSILEQTTERKEDARRQSARQVQALHGIITGVENVIFAIQQGSKAGIAAGVLGTIAPFLPGPLGAAAGLAAAGIGAFDRLTADTRRAGSGGGYWDRPVSPSSSFVVSNPGPNRASIHHGANTYNIVVSMDPDKLDRRIGDAFAGA